MGEEKSFKPTKRRLEKARRDGQAAKSALLTQVFSSGCAFLALMLWVSWTWVSSERVIRYCLEEGFRQPLFCFRAAGEALLAVSACGLAVLCGTAVLFEALQVGIRMELGLVFPRSDRLDLFNGIKKMGSGIRESWLLVFKLVVLLAVFLWFCRYAVLIALPGVLIAPPQAGLIKLGSLILGFFGVAFLTLSVLSGLDYWVRRRAFMRSVSMSAEELKQELKQDEGDPALKSYRRSLHEALALQDLARRIRTTRVIIVERR